MTQFMGLKASESERESVVTSQEPIDLLEIARRELEEARRSDAGRAARTLISGAGAPLSQTVIALTSGATLHEHSAPGVATIQVLIGAAHLTWDGKDTPLLVGEWARIPEAVHGLEATEDFAALLTVSPA